MPSSSSRGGTPRPRRASSPSAPARPGAPARPTPGRRPGAARRGGLGSTAGSVLATEVRSEQAGGRRWWAIALILVVLAVMLVPTVRRYVDQRHQIAALREHIAQQQQNVDALSRERATWDDPAFVESQARQRLHFVKAGETGYTLTTRQDAVAAAKDAKVVGVDAAAAALPWYGKVWGSLQSADRLGAERPTGTPTPGPSITDTRTVSPSTSVPAGRRRGSTPAATATTR